MHELVIEMNDVRNTGRYSLYVTVPRSCVDFAVEVLLLAHQPATLMMRRQQCPRDRVSFIICNMSMMACITWLQTSCATSERQPDVTVTSATSAYRCHRETFTTAR